MHRPLCLNAFFDLQNARANRSIDYFFACVSGDISALFNVFGLWNNRAIHSNFWLYGLNNFELKPIEHLRQELGQTDEGKSAKLAGKEAIKITEIASFPFLQRTVTNGLHERQHDDCCNFVLVIFFIDRVDANAFIHH